MADKDDEQKDNKPVDISDFFTKDRQENGAWYEPVINEKGIGIKMKIVGSDSEHGVKAFKKYNEDLAVISKMTDEVKMSESIRKSLASCAASLTVDIQGADGRKMLEGGKECVYSNEKAYKLFYNSPLLANVVTEFSKNDVNYMNI